MSHRNVKYCLVHVLLQVFHWKCLCMVCKVPIYMQYTADYGRMIYFFADCILYCSWIEQL